MGAILKTPFVERLPPGCTGVEPAEQRFSVLIDSHELVQTNAQNSRPLKRVPFKMIATGIDGTIRRARPEEHVLVHVANESIEIPTRLEGDCPCMQRILVTKKN